jgi:hypothetical protein
MSIDGSHASRADVFISVATGGGSKPPWMYASAAYLFGITKTAVMAKKREALTTAKTMTFPRHTLASVARSAFSY